MCHGGPSFPISIDGFEKRLADIEVQMFYETICAGIVATDTNMIDVISLGNIFESFKEGGAVVCNNFANRAPTTKNIFENPISNGSCVFRA